MQHSSWPLEAVDVIVAFLQREDRPAWYRAHGYYEDALAYQRFLDRESQAERHEREHARRRLSEWFERYTFYERYGYRPEEFLGCDSD